MTSTAKRRPLPALVFLLALSLLAALVWWRVLHRSSGDAVAAPCPTHSAPAPAVTLLPRPGSITLVVLNATHRNGIAGAARTSLLKDGFKIPDAAANDDPKTRIRGVAQIRFGPQAGDGAALVRYFVPGAKMVMTRAKNAKVIVSLGNKYKGVAKPAAARAAMKRDNVAPSPPARRHAGRGGRPSC